MLREILCKPCLFGVLNDSGTRTGITFSNSGNFSFMIHLKMFPTILGQNSCPSSMPLTHKIGLFVCSIYVRIPTGSLLFYI